MHERLLQFIWTHLYFRQENLLTTDHQPLLILNPGHVNDGDGPDFKQASIQMDDLVFHGDIEIHMESGGWYTHRHHEDGRYDKVILHVVMNDHDLVETRRTDQTIVPTLVLKPYINENTSSLFRKSRKKASLACAGLIKDMNHATVAKQWANASDQYFNYKIQELQKTYDSSLPPSEAWRHLLTEAIFDGLGIANNRTTMRRLFRNLLVSMPNPNIFPFKDVLECGLSIAGIDTTTNPGYLTRHDWSFSNTRPANQPASRIPQAIAMWYILWQIPLPTILNEPITSSWTLLNNIESMSKPVGSERKNVLFATVYIPAIHILGSLFQDEELLKHAFKAWKEVEIKVPGSILGAFRRSGLGDELIRDNPATIYQFKHLCKEGRCDECEIMKMILKP